MKLVFFIDSLGSGGAQRQLCSLAWTLTTRGHEVTLVTYNQGKGDDRDFFEPWIAERGIVHTRLPAVPRWCRPWALRHALAGIRPDAVLAFQEAPSLYAELAGLPWRVWSLVVSERNSEPNSHRGFRGWMRALHRLADHVTSNSVAGRSVTQASPGCRYLDVDVVYNMVDLTHFIPEPAGARASMAPKRCLRLVVLARHEPQKNLRNVLEAMLQLRGRAAIHLRWYGGVRSDATSFRDGIEFVRANNLEQEIEFLPPTQDPREAYWDSDGVLLASLYEGCPNVICEAMACGKPVLASAVSDIPQIVEDGISGLLFDPLSPESIADTILRFAGFDRATIMAMGTAGRLRAESLFDPDVFTKRYEELLSCAVERRRTPFFRSR